MISSGEEVVYQDVTPGEPEQNGRCCLNGVGPVVSRVGVVVETFVGSAGSGMVDRSVVGRLELDVRGETWKKKPQTHLDP